MANTLKLEIVNPRREVTYSEDVEMARRCREWKAKWGFPHARPVDDADCGG